MPPGYLQIAGGYYMIESGSCGEFMGLISTTSECDAAATALGLWDTTYGLWDTTYGLWDATYFGIGSGPPGCVFHSSDTSLDVYGPGSTGSCSSAYKCICTSTSSTYSYDLWDSTYDLWDSYDPWAGVGGEP